MFPRLLFITLIMHSLVGCIKEPTKETTSADDFDRKNMLTNLADNYILPGYVEYSSQINNLESSWLAFKTSPNSSQLNVLKTSFDQSLLTWQTIAFLEFGPASSIALRSQTNIYPIDTDLINSNINAGVMDVSSVANYTAKGFQALDYLLFHKATDVDQISYLSDIMVIQYLDAILFDLKTNASYVSAEWNSYKETFIANNISNAVGSSVSEISNTVIAHYETYIRKGKIGLPLGVFNGFSQLPLPSHVEGLYSKANLKYAVQSVVYFYKFLNGNSYEGQNDGLGLLDYANYVDATVNNQLLSKEISQQINAITTYSENIISSWENEVANNSANHLNLYQEYQKLIPLLKVDLTSAIGVSISYQDNDGD